MHKDDSEDLIKTKLNDDFSREKATKKTHKDRKDKEEKSSHIDDGFSNSVYKAFKSSAPKDVRDEMDR